MTTPDIRHPSQFPSEQPAVLIFAGPNGSGKSSMLAKVLSGSLSHMAGAYINADDIAKTLETEFPDYLTRNLRAAQIAEQRRMAALEAGQDFAFETVMSTPEKVALFTQAKARGYEVTLVFVSTNDPAINVARVANRVAMGGHPVREDAIRERYARTLSLLACAVEHADYAQVYDNSEGQTADALLVASKVNGELSVSTFDDRDTGWVDAWLTQPWLERVASHSHLLTMMEEDAAKRGKDCPEEPSIAEAANKSEYWGVAVAKSNHHFLLRSVEGEYSVHDRQLVATVDIEEGKWCCVQYRYAPGGKIDRSDLIDTPVANAWAPNAAPPLRRGPSR